MAVARSRVVGSTERPAAWWLVLTLTLLTPWVEASIASGQSVRGELRLLELESEVFGNTRFLRVWLPPGYGTADDDRRYPVLYLSDGQNLFDAASALFGTDEWRVDETATELIAASEIEPLVIVGVDNAGRRGRAREYLPYPDEFLQPPEPEPQGRRYGDFLAREVLPFVEARFRVRSDAAGRALGGSSYGALVALHVAVTRPELFSHLLLESPSFYVDDGHVLRDVEAAPLHLRRVYLGVGTNELGLEGCPDHPGNREAVEDVQRLVARLERVGVTRDDGLLVLVEPCAVHGEAAWARRLPRALRFLFGP